MTNPDPLAAILAEAERNRRQDRAASASAGTVSVAASTGDGTVTTAGGGGGNSVTLDANGKIPEELLYPAQAGEVARTYTHRQDTAAQVWQIPHNLGGYPEPVLVDENGGPLPQGEVRYPDPNHIVIVFGHPRVGVAHLSL